MFAIIELKGHQYKVQNNEIIVTEKIDQQENSEIEIDKVLLFYDGKELKVGRPYLNMKIKGKILEHFKGPKIVDFKYTPKKRYRKKRGHRQNLTKVQIIF
ncbi:MAG: 50S ribosomal protein L21 [bacterium]